MAIFEASLLIVCVLIYLLFLKEKEENFDDNHILFSIGEYRSRYLAQDLNSTFGKILMINIKNKMKFNLFFLIS